MESSESVHSDNMAQRDVLQDVRTVRTIALVLFDGYALREAAVLAVFQVANALAEAEAARSGQIPYQVCFLSTRGGRVDNSSSSGFVWTEDLEARFHSGGFRALFIGGGAGACDAVGDERLTTWLRRECPRSERVVPIGEARLLLEAAGFGRAGRSPGEGERDPDPAQYPLPDAAVSKAFVTSTRWALAVVQEDFGAEIARQVANHILPRPQQTRFTATVRGKAPGCASEKIQTSARWLEANSDRPIAIHEAARVAAMSERNFLRRFKIQMGVTPSEYLLAVRLDMCCRLLADTDLPVEKIARRCGLRDGGSLAKLFRKHLATTPTGYRANKRCLYTSS